MSPMQMPFPPPLKNKNEWTSKTYQINMLLLTKRYYTGDCLFILQSYLRASPFCNNRDLLGLYIVHYFFFSWPLLAFCKLIQCYGTGLDALLQITQSYLFPLF